MLSDLEVMTWPGFSIESVLVGVGGGFSIDSERVGVGGGLSIEYALCVKAGLGVSLENVFVVKF